VDSIKKKKTAFDLLAFPMRPQQVWGLEGTLIVHTVDPMPSSESVLLVDEMFSRQSAEVIEIPLLLSAGQMAALEKAAHHRGLTAGEMVRQLLQEFIASPPATVQPIPRQLSAF
jgi:hypothetical protein